MTTIAAQQSVNKDSTITNSIHGNSEPEPNNMEMWPSDSVIIFNQDMSAEEIKAKIEPTSDTFKPDAVYRGSDALGVPNPIPTYSSQSKHFASSTNPSPHRALLFLPGLYENVDFEVGYYVQMAGLGAGADDVRFIGSRSGPFVAAINKDLACTEGGTINYAGSGLSLDTFWRSAENFSASCSEKPETCWQTIEDPQAKDTCKGMMWAVSQAAPLRRVHIKSDLWFHDFGAYASGGFLANSLVEGKTFFGPQQQWVSRNVEFQGGNPNNFSSLHDEPENDHTAWNSVYVGCVGEGMPQHGINKERTHATTIINPDIRVEKPFVTYEEERFKLRVPAPTRDPDQLIGPHITQEETDDVRDFTHVKLGLPNDPKDIDCVDTYNTLTEADQLKTQELQAALDEGKDLVLCPGEFFLTKTLILSRPNQVILGLGLATLVAPQDGTPCIRILPTTPGVRVAGIMLEGSVQKSRAVPVSSLLEVGEESVNDGGNKDNPVVLTDVFARVGGANLNRKVSTDVMLRIHSGNVIGDNLWLWRADHVRLRPGEEPNDPKFPYYHQTEDDECHVKNAIEVNGDDVQMTGLFCEHTLQHQLVWNGERGQVFFYQSELPYDVSPEDFKGYVGYFVNQNVKDHVAKGVGVYSNFTKKAVDAVAGVMCPPTKGLEHVFTRFLSNLGSIKSVMNDDIGKAVNKDFVGPSFADPFLNGGDDC